MVADKNRLALSLKGLSIRVQFGLIGGALVLGLLVVGGLSYDTFASVAVNGRQYRHIMQGKDVIADVLPPPEYVIESHLVLHEMAQERDPQRLAAAARRIADLETEYDSRHRYWVAELPPDSMKQALVVESYRPAREFYDLASSAYLPAILNGRRSEAEALLSGPLSEKYARHRAAIDRVVQLATQRNAATEGSVRQTVARRANLLLGVVLAVLGICLACVWHLARRCVRHLDRLVFVLERVAAGDLNQRLDEDDCAEMQRVTLAFNAAVEHAARHMEQLEASNAEQLQATTDLREGQALVGAIQETSLDSIITIDSRGDILAFNAAAEATFGYSAEYALGKCLADLIVPERLRTAHRRGIAHYLATGEGPVLGKRIEVPALRASGEEFPSELAIVAIKVRGAVCFTATLRDLTAQKQSDQALERAATLDTLTGLPNRLLLLDRVQQALLRARQTGGIFGLLFLDFDRFKLINDCLGHDVGDALLCEIAVRLKSELRSADTPSHDDLGSSAARMGGDEFVVLLEPIQHPADVQAVADRLLRALSQPYRLGPHEVFSTASIGVVVAAGDYERAEDVIRDADTAMYEAKRAGKARHALFDEEMRNRVQRRHLLEHDLRHAIEGRQLSLEYQPIVSLESGELKSVEALLRWRHPTQGNISPAEFIPIAEESDLILRIGSWVLAEGTRQMADWVARLGTAAPPTVSINLSRKQFSQNDLAEQIDAAAQAAGLPLQRMQLEITEDTFASDVPAAIAAMHAIKRLGVALAIDDFGTGCSSFASLQEFPADVLKIDRSLLIDIETSKETAALVHALAILVKNLGMEIIAEGVERESQILVLRELGCSFGQGYYFARPLSPEAFADFALQRAAGGASVAGAAAFQDRWSELAGSALNRT